MNIEAAVRFKRCAGRRWSGGRLVGLKHDLALEKYASPARSRTPPMQKKSHWTVPAPALLSSPMQPSAKAPQQSSPSPGDREFESCLLQRRVSGEPRSKEGPSLPLVT